MSQKNDLLIHGGWVIDPANGRDGPADVVVRAGQVSAVGQGLDAVAERVIDARGHYVVPGLVDSHVHIASATGERVAHRMLARAGVTTALDLAGPTAGFLTTAARYGAGLNVACIEKLAPGANVPGRDPTAGAIRDAIWAAMAGGAIGVKLHYDSALTPGAAGRAIAVANELGVYVAMHCGTTATNSDMTGLREAVELAGDGRLHIAHVNSYCRGSTAEPAEEAAEALRLLRNAPRLYSEAYVAAINGNWAGCVDGVPERARVRGWLEAAGYPGTQEGMRAAILAGYARIPVETGDAIVLVAGREGVAAWEAAGTKISVSFPLNPPISRLMLATSKGPDGRFDIDAMATDGGFFPRNNLVEAGLALIELEALTRSEFVQKVAWTPARVLGLAGKGHLGVGADADIAVIDPRARQATTTICGGTVIMHQGTITGHGSTVLTTSAGAGAVERAGCRPHILDLSLMGLYTGDGLKA